MKKNLISLFLILLLLSAAAAAVILIESTQPKAKRESATKKTAMLVDVVKVERADYRPRIHGLGTVEASKDIALNPRIEGRVVEIAENFLPGGFVKTGQVLLRLDPADYQNDVLQKESALAQAQSQLSIELGLQDVARKEFDLLSRKNLTSGNKALVLREPQLASAKAAVKSAEAMLQQARLELERTSVVAPFEAQILSTNVNIGSEVDSNTPLAHLVGIDEYWVLVSVPTAQLEYIIFPGQGGQGAMVTIRNRMAWKAGEIRHGRVIGLVGALDQQTRLARVLVSVKDPLAHQSGQEKAKLLVGAIVQAEIEGRPLEDVYRIKRQSLREGDRLWLNRNGKLTITQAKVLFKDKQYAYLTEGLEDGDLLVTNNLATVAEGILLRTEGDGQMESSSLTEPSK